MQKFLVSLVAAFVFSMLFSLASAAQAAGDGIAEELRPFDFADKYYEENGIFAYTLVGRKNGADGQSVFDRTDEPKYTNVRITATLPAYSGDGSPLYWNFYAGASKESFATLDAVDAAYANPMYVFPSTTAKKTDRQAALIRMSDGYYEKNPLGLAAVFVATYTEAIFSKRGRIAMQVLAERNGVSHDGTPIIRSAKEIVELVAQGYLTVRQAGEHESDPMPFAVAKVIREPEKGGIAPDAFLIYVKQSGGDKPLDAEAHFVTSFECMKDGTPCL